MQRRKLVEQNPPSREHPAGVRMQTDCLNTFPSSCLNNISRVCRVRPIQRCVCVCTQKGVVRENCSNQRWYHDAASSSVPIKGQGTIFYFVMI